MNKRRQRMESFREVVRQKPNHRPPPEVWTRKDKLVVCGAFAAALLTFLGIPVLRSTIAHRQTVNQRLAAWEKRFQLSEPELLRLREIEFDFHGSSFQLVPETRTLQQLEAHKQELSRAMNPESALEFIEYFQNRAPCGR